MNTQTISNAGLPGGNQVLSTQRSSFSDNPFLRLLIQEMRSQTPLEPMDNGAFMEQMATFSAMEEQKELNTNLLKLLDFQGVLARTQGLSEGSALLGKEVTYSVAEGETNKGVVESVFVDEDGEVKLKVGEDTVELRRVLGIAEPGAKKSDA